MASDANKIRDEVIDLVTKISEEDVKTGTAKREDVEASFIEGVNVDSLMALEIVSQLEKKYNIEIKEEDLPKLGTIDDMVDLVVRLTQAKTGQGAGTKDKGPKKIAKKVLQKKSKKHKKH